jgi:hypothetical protein
MAYFIQYHTKKPTDKAIFIPDFMAAVKTKRHGLDSIADSVTPSTVVIKDLLVARHDLFTVIPFGHDGQAHIALTESGNIVAKDGAVNWRVARVHAAVLAFLFGTEVPDMRRVYHKQSGLMIFILLVVTQRCSRSSCAARPASADGTAG